MTSNPIVWWAPLTLADIGLREVLSPTERARVAACTAQADAARRLLGAAVLRCAVASLTGEEPHLIRIDRACDDCGEHHGRPRSVDHDLHLSVSHSGLLTVVAVHEHPVGVDVEKTDRAPAGEIDAWVRREASFKCGVSQPELAALNPPVAGYAAVLAMAQAQAPTELDASLLLAEFA